MGVMVTGGGIGGLTADIALRRVGAEVVVFARRPRKEHEMVPRKVDVHKHELAAGVGLVSLGIGPALSFAPDRIAALLGWGGRARLARVIGAAGLVVGPALILGRRRSEWMVARAL